MNNKIIDIIKLVLIYLHRYVGMWCIIMGYIVLLGLILFNEMVGFKELRAIGILIAILIIGVSKFAEEQFEKNIYRSFGVWW